MSLAQHVTATEGVDRDELLDADDECGEPTWRRLSFDAFAPAENVLSVVPLGEPAPHIAAYKISPARRVAQIVLAVVLCSLGSGIVYGFASLKPVLIAEGVYRDLCPLDDPDAADSFEIPCPEQDIRLNLFFVAGSIATNVSCLLAGFALDRFGRRFCYVASACFIAAGCVLMALAFRIPEFDGYLLSNLLLGLGGTFLFVSSYELANAFPKYQGHITAVITGAFDASAAVFLFYHMAWEATEGSFTPDQFFLAYLIVPVLILVGEFTLMPKASYHTTPELERKIEKAQDSMRDIHDSDQDLSDGEMCRVRSNRAELRQNKLDRLEDLVGDFETREERAHQEEERQVVSGIWGVLHGLPAHRQMLTPWFILLLLLTVFQMLRMNYFIATIRAQYRYMLGTEDLAEEVNNFFDIALPVGGILATPFIGVILNSVSVATMLAILSGCIVLIGVLNCLPFLWSGYATVVAFVFFRPFYYSAVSDYATKVFGFKTFGRVYGTITCVSGLVNFGQSGLDALTHGPLDGNPVPVNIFMAVGGTILGLSLSAYVTFKTSEFQEQEKVERESDEQMPLIPEEPTAYGATH